ncbi:transposase, partial [Pseudodesulfovibrio sp. JC047]|uniref:transposase n=1 Tax=Pseudodesulfovibrio sp. JC047 TaxID=2683199 RepID=UPI0013D3FE55
KGKGRLRPVGQRRLRSLLIEAAWIWKQKDEWARGFYNRIYSQSGVAQKAIAALARKLAALLWKLSLPVAQS